MSWWGFLIIMILALILIGTVIWAFVWIKKKDNPVRLSQYLFAYRIIKDDARALPTQFLVDWQISNLENHLYLLYLTLEEDLYIEGYLHSVWVDYKGLDNVYVEVYRVEEGDKHTLIGKFCIVEGRRCYTPV